MEQTDKNCLWLVLGMVAGAIIGCAYLINSHLGKEGRI